MADTRVLCVGFSSATRVARFQLGNLEVTIETEEGPLTLTLPALWLRLVDLLLDRWRREDHEVALLERNDCELGLTLQQAARAGGLLDTKFLIARGTNVHHGYRGRNVLDSSVRSGNLAVVKVVLDAGGGRHPMEMGWLNASLALAATYGHTSIAALLLDSGASIQFYGNMPLRQAAWENHLETVKLLLDRGADIHAANDDALRGARENGHEAVVALLLERGARADAAD